MSHSFQPVTDAASLQTWFDRSADEPVVFFNFDRHCVFNVAAYRQMESIDTPVCLVDVTRDHEVKTLLATLTGVRHESPQVVVVYHRRVVWSGSHGAITSAKVTRAVSMATHPEELPGQTEQIAPTPWFARWFGRRGS